MPSKIMHHATRHAKKPAVPVSTKKVYEDEDGDGGGKEQAVGLQVK